MPSLRAIYKQYQTVAGVDEAGRGSLAGPVVAAACIFYGKCEGLNDSKQLTFDKRKKVVETIKESPKNFFGIGVVDPQIIDEINIHQAVLLAMRIAIQNLPKIPDFLLVDGIFLPVDTIPGIAIPQGDEQIPAIMAASNLAKVFRDEMMIHYDQLYPGFGFAKHMGYGTKEHREALQKGFSAIHRKSFEPLKSMILC